jgi:hypothetical protein
MFHLSLFLKCVLLQEKEKQRSEERLEMNETHKVLVDADHFNFFAE